MRCKVAVGLLALLLCASTAFAQDKPTKQILTDAQLKEREWRPPSFASLRPCLEAGIAQLGSNAACAGARAATQGASHLRRWTYVPVGTTK